MGNHAWPWVAAEIQRPAVTPATVHTHFTGRSLNLYDFLRNADETPGMDIGSTAQFFAGISVALGVLVATLVSSSASIRASQSWVHHHRVRATAFASFAGLSGIVAVGGLVYAISLIAVNSPFAT